MGKVRQAANTGDRALLLAEIQAKLASELDAVVLGRDAAVIARELRATSADLAQIKPAEGSALDELARERAKRREKPTGT